MPSAPFGGPVLKAQLEQKLFEQWVIESRIHARLVWFCHAVEDAPLLATLRALLAAAEDRCGTLARFLSLRCVPARPATPKLTLQVLAEQAHHLAADAQGLGDVYWHLAGAARAVPDMLLARLCAVSCRSVRLTQLELRRLTNQVMLAEAAQRTPHHRRRCPGVGTMEVRAQEVLRNGAEREPGVLTRDRWNLLPQSPPWRSAPGGHTFRSNANKGEEHAEGCHRDGEHAPRSPQRVRGPLGP